MIVHYVQYSAQHIRSIIVECCCSNSLVHFNCITLVLLKIYKVSFMQLEIFCHDRSSYRVPMVSRSQLRWAGHAALTTALTNATIFTITTLVYLNFSS